MATFTPSVYSAPSTSSVLHQDCLLRPSDVAEMQQRREQFYREDNPLTFMFIDSYTAMYDIKLPSEEAKEAYIRGRLIIQESRTGNKIEILPEHWEDQVLIEYIDHYYDGLDL